MHRAIAVMRDRNRSGRAAAAKQLAIKNTANPGRFARKKTARTKMKLCPKLINCAVSTGTTAMIPMSNPRTTICQGYSKMLTPVTVFRPRYEKSGIRCEAKSKAQNCPVTTRDQNRHANENTKAASSQ